MGFFYNNLVCKIMKKIIEYTNSCHLVKIFNSNSTTYIFFYL
jgi:hypothetical protein